MDEKLIGGASTIRWLREENKRLSEALEAAEERARVAESVLADIEHQVMLIDASGDEINREAKFEALRIIAAVLRPKEPTE